METTDQAQPPAVKISPKLNLSEEDMLESEKRTQPDGINPSLEDGMSIRKIRAWRRQYVEFLLHVGRHLRISPWAIATAILYCHKFFSIKSMKKNDRFLIASACLHLAAKVQESPKSIKDVIKECDAFRFSGNSKKRDEYLNDPAKMDERKEEVLMAERAVLYTLGFDLTDLSASSSLLNVLGDLGLSQDSSDAALPIDMRFKDFLQSAWDLMNDSFRTQVCLKLEPKKLACAAIFLADMANQKQPGSISIMQLINEKEAVKKSGKVHEFCSYFDISSEDIQFFTDEVVSIYEVSICEDKPEVMEDDESRPLKRKIEEVEDKDGDEEPSKRIKVEAEAAVVPEPAVVPEATCATPKMIPTHIKQEQDDQAPHPQPTAIGQGDNLIESIQDGLDDKDTKF